MNETKLLSCPFCGGEAKMHSRCNYVETGGETMFFASCENCKSEGVWKYKKEEAINAWNTRKPVESIVESLEEELEYSKDNFRDTEVIYRKGLRYALKIMKEVGA